MSWLEGAEAIVQLDGDSDSSYYSIAHPAGGEGGGWNIKLATQPEQSPDLNLNDLAVVRALLKSRVWRERFGSLEEFSAGV